MDRVALEDMRTGVKMLVDMSLDMSSGMSVISRKPRPWVWSLMENAGIDVEGKPTDKRGWRK
jgi:hypothetical protein